MLDIINFYCVWLRKKANKKIKVMKVIYVMFFFFPFLVVDDSVFYGILVALLGFLLVKFYTRVEEIGKDVKQLLINEARNTQKIDHYGARLEEMDEEIKDIRDHLDA